MDVWHSLPPCLCKRRRKPHALCVNSDPFALRLNFHSILIGYIFTSEVHVCPKSSAASPQLISSLCCMGQHRCHSSAHIMMFALTRAGRVRVSRSTNLQSEMRLINVSLLIFSVFCDSKLIIFQFRIVRRTKEPFEKCFIDQTIILKKAVTLENTHFDGLTPSAEGMILVSRMLKRFC